MFPSWGKRSEDLRAERRRKRAVLYSRLSDHSAGSVSLAEQNTPSTEQAALQLPMGTVPGLLRDAILLLRLLRPRLTATTSRPSSR